MFKTKWMLAAAGLTAAAVAAEPNPYGACAHVTRGEPAGRTCAMMRQAGLGWVRSDFDWSAVAPKKGAWDFSRFDRVIAECEAEGVQLLPILGYSVAWAHPAHEHLDEWEEYVRRVVERYGSRLGVLEVWNEENIPPFWAAPDPTNYLAVLRRTFETAKKVNPAVRVAFGGTAGVPLDFIEEVYRLGGAKWFDIMNIHPYSHPARPEGAMDAQIERLRALMARYGDAAKPLWITEVGWPTHRMGFSLDGLLEAGLKVARPDAVSWRMLYVPARGDADENAIIRDLLLEILPEGSSVEICRSADLAAALAKGGVDGIVYPFTEDYASDSVDAVFEFVKAGGVLVDFGGMPMWYAYREAPGGGMEIDKTAQSWRDRGRLRIAETAYWSDKRFPESIPVRPSAAAKGVKAPPGGFAAQRFFTPRLLKPGDEMLPLLCASTNGVDTVAAAVYRFNSDMKGAVVVSGLLGRGSGGTSSPGRQARMLARALGIAFAEGVENFFWYEFRELDAAPCDPESYFGIVRGNFAPKPAYGAYMTFIGIRPPGSVQSPGTWRSADGTVFFPQWTRPDGRKAGMVWTVGDTHRRELRFSSPGVEFFDVGGARVRPEREGCVFTLRISGSPIYFSGGELDWQ